MEDVLRNITSEPTEEDEDNRKRMARERQGVGAPVYDEKELEDIFVRTYGSNSRENAAYKKAGFNRYNKSVSEADWYAPGMAIPVSAVFNPTAGVCAPVVLLLPCSAAFFTYQSASDTLLLYRLKPALL